MAQISINTKTEETDRLKKYIINEQEKLDEAKKFLEQDKEKFEALMNDSEKMAKAVADDVKAKGYERQKLIKNIEELTSKINQKDA